MRESLNVIYQIGDLVLVSKGQKTKFFEVKEVHENKVTIENGWVQIEKTFDQVDLICKKEDRRDLLRIGIN